MLRSNLSAITGLSDVTGGRLYCRPPLRYAVTLESQSEKPSPKLCFGDLKAKPFAH
jgi:hypothetical protein